MRALCIYVTSYTMTITEMIRARHSVRDYTGIPLNARQKKTLARIIADTDSPFGGEVDIRIVSAGDASPFTPTTYGMIRGARDFMLLGIAPDKNSLISAGYIAEHAVLEATAMGLGTCWMSGTFSKTAFGKAASMRAKTPLTIVIARGVPAARKSFTARAAGFLAGSDKRRLYGELFHNADGSPATDDGSPVAEALEMMRLAPSGVNSQPWRAVVGNDAKRVDFYTKSTKPMAFVDMGIGMSHFVLAARERGLNGIVTVDGTALLPHEKGLEYIASYIIS